MGKIREMATEEVEARLVVLDKLAAVIFSTHEEGDSASDYREKIWKALRVLEPVMKATEIVAPCDGPVSNIEAVADLNIADWQKDDPMLKVGSETVAIGRIGRITAVLVKDGDTVRKGQPLLKFNEYIACR